jgi:V/A-type H+-transporting ATPase subunit D
MAKIRLTKNELKKQKDNLKRFMRYLPTLELKKKQLLQEIRRIQGEIDRLDGENQRMEKAVSAWAAVFTDAVDLEHWIKIEEIVTGRGNIAGIDIPTFEDLLFKSVEIDTWHTPFWIDRGIELCKEQIRRLAEMQIAGEQLEVLHEELRITVQRIKLFEEVKIPEARENIRIIRIFLGDLQTAEVVRGKIAKAKIEKKRLAGSTA